MTEHLGTQAQIFSFLDQATKKACASFELSF